MKIYEEKSLSDFDFWDGAADRAANLTDDDFDVIEREFEMLYPDGMDSTTINDLFWFEFDWIVKFLGYENEADFDRKRDPFFVDDDELEDYVEEWFRKFLVKPTSHKNVDFIVNIYENLFDGDWRELAETPSENEETEGDVIPMWAGRRAYKYLMGVGATELMESLFDDDRGEYETDGEIPSKENFRELIMDQKRLEDEKSRTQ